MEVREEKVEEVEVNVDDEKVEVDVEDEKAEMDNVFRRLLLLWILNPWTLQ